MLATAKQIVSLISKIMSYGNQHSIFRGADSGFILTLKQPD